MTTIHSTASDLNRLELCRVPDGDVMLSIRYGSAIYVREADLKAALGIDELGCGCDEADENLKAAIRRAEDAEAFGAATVKRAEEAEAEALEQAKLVRDWADRAEKYDHLANDLANELKAVAAKGDHWQARAEKAEAKLDRVDMFMRSYLDSQHQSSVVAARVAEKLRAALDPKPAFTLPTEVPARIVAVKRSTGSETELTLFTDGDTTWWADIEDWGPFWTRSQVMEQFTDHRLIGADQ